MTDDEWRDPRWCGARPVLAGEAMECWVTILRACRPWSDMPLDDVTGEFGSVLDALLDSARDRSSGEHAARLRSAARAHGAFRRRQRCLPTVLGEEVAFAEEAIAAMLYRGGAAAAVITTIQDELAPVLRAIERAAYSGYADWSGWPGTDI